MSGIFVFICLMVLMAFGFYVRVPYDHSYNYNMDEAIHVNIASGKSLAEVLQFSRNEGHPPLLYMFVHYWKMISPDPGFVRSFALLVGMLLIPLYYFIGRRVGGELCGIYCAVLISLSHGCIVQSYVVRQYCVFMLFSSLSFYCYLCWRESRRRSLLLWYVLWGWLTALSHFSAIFFYFSLSLFEACALLRRKMERRILIEWLSANLAVAAFAGYIYSLWWPIITVAARRFSYMFPTSSLSQAISEALNAPLIEAGYIYPTFPLLLMIPVYASLPGFFSRNRAALYPYFILAGVACLLRIALCITGVYPVYPGLEGRHNLWMLPLIVPALGGMIAQLLETDAAKPAARRIHARPMIALLFAFAIISELGERFVDRGEMWSLSQKQWLELNHAVDELTPGDLIVVESEPGELLTNFFPYIGDDELTGVSMAAVVPYRNTRILFNPYYPRFYNQEMLLATLQEAKDKHMLDHIKRLVFIDFLDFPPPISDLILCDALEKRVIGFPSFPANRPLDRPLLYNGLSAVMMFVPKQAILNDVLPATGKAHACLDGKHDLFHGLITPAAHK